MIIEKISKKLFDHFEKNFDDPPTQYTIELILDLLSNEDLKELYKNKSIIHENVHYQEDNFWF